MDCLKMCGFEDSNGKEMVSISLEHAKFTPAGITASEAKQPEDCAQQAQSTECEWHQKVSDKFCRQHAQNADVQSLS